MNVITRCPGCQGRKKVFGMGLVEHDCERCGGKGNIPVSKVKADLIEALKDEAKDERENDTKTVAESKRKYVRKGQENAPNGVCDVA